MRKRSTIAVLVVALTTVAGCSRSGKDTSSEAPSSADATRESIQEEVVAESTDLVASLIQQPEALAVAIARRMYAAELGVEEASVAVRGSEEVTWNDGSLGCPKPGESYTQVITPGYRITLTDGTNDAVYHSGTNQGGGAPVVIRCDKPAPAGDASFGGPAALKAIADLKEREGVTDVTVEDSFVAPVADLMCDGDVSDQPSEGPTRIILEFHLRSGETSHVYRAWGDDILYCGTTDDLAIQ